MEKLVSNLSNVKALPKDYIFPVEQRPGDALNAPVCTSIPVIDLAKAGLGRADVIQQILSASQEFGFFQVINHGVPANLMKETMNVVDEFFSMSDEDKASLYSEDATKSCRLFTSRRTNCAAEKGLLWRDNLRHHCHPLEAFIHLWPEKPARYRDVVGKYSVEVRSLSMKILEMIREGLGLEPDFFEGGITDKQLLSINRYPPCPEPSLSLGLAKHADPNVITLLLQGLVYGLQVFKDGQWIGVEPLPNAFVVNIGYQLQIISNGRFKSSEHRAVTNSKETRTTIVSFISPCGNCIVEPAEALINEVNPLLYKAYQYQDFINSYNHKFGSTENVLKDFMVD